MPSIVVDPAHASKQNCLCLSSFCPKRCPSFGLGGGQIIKNRNSVALLFLSFCFHFCSKTVCAAVKVAMAQHKCTDLKNGADVTGPWHGRSLGTLPKNASRSWHIASERNDKWVLIFCRQANHKIMIDFRFYYMATCGYTSRNSDEMGFEKGDILRIVQKRVDGWWKAR